MNVRTKILFCILTSLVASADASTRALTPVEIFARLSPSTWSVKTYDKDELPLGSGSAVVIGNETVVTNCHVLRKASRITLTHQNISLGGTLEYWDTARDVCQIKAKNLSAPAVKLGTTSGLQVGQTVYTLGNPTGRYELTLSSGLISSLRKRDGSQQQELIQTTAPISPGSSGGGLFDDQGRLIGITTLIAIDGQNINFAIPVEWVKELPTRHKVAREKEAADRNALSERQKEGKSDISAKKSWHYQFRDVYGKQKQFSVGSSAETADAVVDFFSVEDESDTSFRWTRKSPMITTRSGGNFEWIEISPFVLSGDRYKVSQYINDASLFGEKFNVDFRVLAEENVVVPAGSFQAVKLRLTGNTATASACITCALGSIRDFELEAWYAKNLGRVVKLKFRSTGLGNSVRDNYEIVMTGAPGNNK